jgi:hypothetical protein
MALQAKTRWKEELHIVDEVGRSFMFDCGWGVTPPVSYVPFEDDWRGCVPDWLHERRQEVIAAMEQTGHRVVEGDYPPLTRRS